MFNGKLKAVTFSYDDGVTQDKRLIEIFNKYGLKATFNLNSGLLGGTNTLVRGGVTVNHNKIAPPRCALGLFGPRGCRPYFDAPHVADRFGR